MGRSSKAALNTVLTALLLFSVDAAAQDGGTEQAAPADQNIFKVAAIGMSGFSVKADLLAFFTEHFAQSLAERGAKVTTPAQIGAAIGFERQRQLIGCAENSECMTEISNALGVDALATGEIALLDSSWRINLKLVNAITGELLTSASARATTKEEVADQISRAAHAMAPIAAKKVNRTLRASAKFVPGLNGGDGQTLPVPPRKNTASLVSIGMGGAFTLGGAVLLGSALSDSAALKRGDRIAIPTYEAATAVQTRMHLMESFSYPLLLSGIGLLLYGVISYQPAPEAPVRAVLMPTSTGLYAGVSGQLP